MNELDQETSSRQPGTAAMAARRAIGERVLITVKGGVAEVRLNRPDKLNALDVAMLEALSEAGAQLATEPDLRAVVLCGEGRAFCAGLDLGRLGRHLNRPDPADNRHAGRGEHAPRTHGISNRAQHACMVWRQLPVPVIAAVQGVAFGGGLQVALGADARYVRADTRLSIMEMKWGLIPDMAGMALTRGLVRPDILRELIYSARIVEGEEACSLGLATRVVADPLAAAHEAAHQIANRNPDAIRAAKRLTEVAMRGDVAEILLAESIEQDKLGGSANQKEAVRANFEHRAPRFQPARA